MFNWFNEGTNKHRAAAAPQPAAASASETDAPFVRLREVRKTYPTGDSGFTALKGVTADFRRGEFVGIVGKSGAGKSTLVNMITGVDDLTEGEIWIDGQGVHTLDESRMALWRGQTIGVVYQTFELLPQLSLVDNVLLPMDFCGRFAGRKSIERAQHLLDQVGLADHMEKPPTKISGGQKQRVAIARALANDPPLIVADEPTGNLDTVTAEGIFELFQALVERGKTVIMVTHDHTLARRVSRVMQIVDGRLIAEQPIAEGA